jgi:hypothetical protein
MDNAKHFGILEEHEMLFTAEHLLNYVSHNNTNCSELNLNDGSSIPQIKLLQSTLYKNEA